MVTPLLAEITATGDQLTNARRDPGQHRVVAFRGVGRRRPVGQGLAAPVDQRQLEIGAAEVDADVAD